MTAKRSALVAVVVVAGLVPYLGGLANPRLWDDRILLGERLAPEHCDGIGDLWRRPYWGDVGPADTYRPLSLSAIYLERRVFGDAVVPYHRVSLGLHVAVCVLILSVIGRLAGERVGWVCALLFAAHPIHAEAVAMVYGQLELIQALFSLLAIRCYLQARDDGVRPGPFAVSLACAACAACSKESGLMLPLVLMLVRASWMTGDGAIASRWRKFTRGIGWDALFLVAMMPYLILRFRALGGLAPDPDATVTLGYTFGLRFNAVLVSLAHALRLVTIPTGQAVYYGHLRDSVFGVPSDEITWIATAGVVLAGLAGSIGGRRVGFGAGWFLLTFLPVSNIIPTGVLVAERTLYLPSLGACFLVAAWIERLKDRWLTRFGFGLILLAALAATRGVVASWRDEETLWRTTVQAHPRSPIAHLKLGQAMLVRWQGLVKPPTVSEWEEADNHFATAIALNLRLVDALVGRGIVAERRGDRASAEDFYRRAVALSPDDPDLRNALRAFLDGRDAREPTGRTRPPRR